MEALQAWRKILNELGGKQREFSTVPRINTTPLWFCAKATGDLINISCAVENQPSCRLAMPRNIRYSDFETVYAFYERWNRGEKGVRNQVRQLSRNTAYIFALIKHIV